MKKKILYILLIVALLAIPASAVAARPSRKAIGINVLLKTDVTDKILTELGKYGKVLDVLESIDALTMRIKEGDLETIQALPFVQSANPDAFRNGSPIDTVLVEDFADGISTWNLDVINVTTAPYEGRTVEYDGTDVYVAVLDTGLVGTWRQYFPEERIAEEYGIAFGGGGGEVGFVSTQPNKWEQDVNSHGTHVTSTIIGYQIAGWPFPITGVAPMATVIPVKVLNQNGSGWSSVVARGIQYVTELKKGPLADYPVVINMSLGGPVLDAVEKAAIDEAIEAGVIIVASAGNNGPYGMGYPGAYEPVISVAASGWAGEWYNSCWWYCLDDPDPNNTAFYYITDFSSVELAGQDLDVAAPGSWVVGPYQVNMGQISYYFLGGTSMASPHVAGVVALMADKKPGLVATEAEAILESTAMAIPGYGHMYAGAGVVDAVAALNTLP